MSKEQIERAIPHRDPFLLLDEVVEITDEKILCSKTLEANDELFSRVYVGHYPGNPITPGVLLCEMIFQAAAVLMSSKMDEDKKGVPVLTRIGGAKFKQIVRPGDTVEISAQFGEQVSNAYYMSGAVKVGGKLAVRVDFTCALAEVEE